MRKLLPVLVLGFLIFQSCHKMPVGFLMTENAGYSPDSLILKSALDTTITQKPNPTYKLAIEILGFSHEQLVSMGILPFIEEYSNPIDYQRYKNGIPWTGTPIQGLKGTAPINVKVYKVTPINDESKKLMSLITVRGSSGVLELPLDHGVAPGRYKLSLRFSNESWSKEKEDIFTLIIE